MQIQLSLQGGGAKLCALLAAAEAIQELEKDGKFEITRIAGTSAGSIVGCLLATKENIYYVKEKIKAQGNDFLKNIIPNSFPGMKYYKIFRGEPLYKEAPLRSFLDDLFKFGDRTHYQRLEDLKIPVFITATDILNGEKHVYSKERQSMKIIDALVASSALPYAFRTFLGDSGIVDGGICENLPCDELLEGEKEFGKVIGITLERVDTPQLPKNILEFTLAMFNAAINNSMNRAKSRLGENTVFEISTDIEILDFESAIEKGLGKDHYQRVKLETKEWFNKLYDLYSRPKEDEQVEQLIVNEQPKVSDIMKKVYDVYCVQHLNANFEILHSSMSVTTYSLLETDHPLYRRYDEVKLVRKIRPLQEPLYSFLISLGSQTLEQYPTDWIVKNCRGEKHNSIIIPVIDESEASSGSSNQDLDTHYFQSVLIFFDPPLIPVNSELEPYKIVQRSLLPSSMQGLLKGGDYMFMNSKQPVEVKECDLVLSIPESFRQKITMRQKTKNGMPVGIPGRKMTETELGRHDDPPPGFISFGWTGEGLKPKKTFGVDFIVVQD